MTIKKLFTKLDKINKTIYELDMNQLLEKYNRSVKLLDKCDKIVGECETQLQEIELDSEEDIENLDISKSIDRLNEIKKLLENNSIDLEEAIGNYIEAKQITKNIHKYLENQKLSINFV